jgi:PTS system nitrogen regulatory IIA component
MNLLKFIQPECILTGVKVSSMEELVRLQADSIIAHTPERNMEGHSPDSLVEMLLERERKQSTGLGNGILVPHARVPQFGHLGLSIAVLAEPLDYDTIDGKPITISCMVMAPAETPNIVIKIWSGLAKLLSDPAVSSYFQHADDAQLIYDYLKTHDVDLKLSVSASDIMTQPRTRLQEDTSLEDVTHLMYKYKEACLSVVDPEGRLVGQVTTDDVFQFGMPEFFQQLQSVSFVRNFNPLEKYFQHEDDLTARDIMSTDFAALPPTATLIEVIFQLSVKKRLKVFITKPDGTLMGVIDRLAVLDRAINF